MPGVNLPPGYDLGQRLSSMEQDLHALATKVPLLTMDTGGGGLQGFSLGTFPGTYEAVPSLGTVTIPVPAGYTTAYITALGSISASCQPTGPTTDWLISYMWITVNPGDQVSNSAGLVTYGTGNGSGGNATPVPYVTQYPNWTGIWEGLTAGSTISAAVKAYTGVGWSAAAANTAGTGLSVLFLP